MRVAIVQSNYIPWKGYFDLIRSADHFILFDDAQYTKRDWRNRNQIKTPSGPEWLTIPVETKGKYLQKIKEVVVSNKDWTSAHWRTIHQNYVRAPFFNQERAWLESLYQTAAKFDRLSDINYFFLTQIMQRLDITTKISWSMDYTLSEGKTERLVDLCKMVGGTTYISGPSAKDYIENDKFQKAGIALEYFDYANYKEYPQIHRPFIHAVSILDLILNTGPHARAWLDREIPVKQVA